MRLDPPGGIVKNPFANDIVAIENTTGLPTADSYNDPFQHAGRFESSVPPSASLMMTATINLTSDRD